MMLYLRSPKLLPAILAAALMFAALSTRPPTAGAADEGVRADLPPGGEVSVVNPRGGVRLEVWGEQHVSVSATVRGEKPKGSPVSIKRTEQLLTVSVNAREVGMLTRVELLVRVPARARASVVSENGAVTVHGLPEALTVESGYGDIRAELPASGDADIEAESLSKRVTSTLPLPEGVRAGGNSLRTRLGSGGRTVRLISKRGAIELSTYGAPKESTVSYGEPKRGATEPRSRSVPTDVSPTAEATPSAEARKKPILIGAEENRPGAGTPSAPLTGPEEVDEGDVVRVDTELVTLNVSVIDRGTNRGLKGLTEADFKLFEDGAQQQISHFEAASAPFNLILLVDVSLSTQEKIGLIRQAALHFVDAARPEDRIGVIAFAKTPEVVSRLTSDRATLRRRIMEGMQPRGSTKVYDSLAFAMDEVMKDASGSRRNAIILMSDGLDSTMPNVTGEGSFTPYKEVLSRVREFDGVLYSLWVNTETEYSSLSPLEVQPETFDLAHDQMQEFAEAGGGVFYEVDRLEDLAGAYESVVADLGTVYSLSYRPTNKQRDGKWRVIRVSVARPGAVARGKRGYYAN